MIAAMSVVTVAVGLVAVAALLRYWRETSGAFVRADLHFGTGLTSEKLEALLSAVAGMPFRCRLAFEINAKPGQIRFGVLADSETLRRFRGLVRGVVPDARLQAEDQAEQVKGRLVAQIKWSGRDVLLQTDHPAEAAAALLGGLTDLGDGESVVFRWHVRPARRPHRIHVQSDKHSSPRLFGLFGPGEVPKDLAKSLRTKYAGPTLNVSGEVAVTAKESGRAGALVSAIGAAVRSRQAEIGSVRFRLRRRSVLVPGAVLGRGARLSPKEIVGLIGWPIDSPQIAGLDLGTSPLLSPDWRLVNRNAGRVVGLSNWPGSEGVPLRQPVQGALSHSLVLGGTGQGKSTLLTNLAADDAAESRGILLIDMKGDTATDLLARIAPERMDEVIVLDPAHGGPVPGLRVFGNADPELSADQLLSTFYSLFRDSFGVRSQQYLRQGFVTLAHDPEATLADLIFLFNDRGYRVKLVSRVNDPMLRAEWAAYESLSPAEQAQHLASPLRKIHEVVGRKIIRAVLAQSKPRFDMKTVLAEGKIVVVSLSPGRLGEPASRLIASLVVYELFKATLARQAVPESQRAPFGLYIDEPKLLAEGSPVPLDQMFELFRGMGVGVTLTAQSLTQLPRDTQRAALSNAATMVVFRQGRADAEMLAKELSGVSAESLQHLGRYEIVTRIGLDNGEVSSPATATTPPPKPIVSAVDEVRARSAKHYGQDPEQVDADLRRRHPETVQTDANSSYEGLGRRRRQS